MLSFFLATILILSPSPSKASVESVGEPNVTWTKKKVHVCWKSGVDVNPSYAQNDFESDVKLEVQKIIEQEYTSDRTGVSFYGWESCSSLPMHEIDLEIYQDNELAPTNPMIEKFRRMGVAGYSCVGQGSSEEKLPKFGLFHRNLSLPVMYLNFHPVSLLYSQTLSSIELLKIAALHEFGHAAGLRHEHIRKEAKTDPNCKYMNLQDEPIYESTVFFEEYDPNSIMNYCWNNALLKQGLTLDDLEGVQDSSLYNGVKN